MIIYLYYASLFHTESVFFSVVSSLGQTWGHNMFNSPLPFLPFLNLSISPLTQQVYKKYDNNKIAIIIISLIFIVHIT